MPISALSTGVDIVLSSSSGNATVCSTILLVCVAGGSLPQPEITWYFSGFIQTNVSTKVMPYSVRVKQPKSRRNFMQWGRGGGGGEGGEGGEGGGGKDHCIHGVQSQLCAMVMHDIILAYCLQQPPKLNLQNALYGVNS